MMQRSIYFILGLVAGLLIMGSLAAVYIHHLKSSFVATVERSGPPDLPRDTSSTIYSDMWEWEVKDLTGTAVRLAEFKGKLVVVHLWATWCPPCVKELPELQTLYDSLRKKDVAFLVVSNENEATVRAFLKGSTYSFPVYTTTEAEPDAFQTDGLLNAIPNTVVLDHAGMIRLKQPGAAVWSDRKTLRFFRHLL